MRIESLADEALHHIPYVFAASGGRTAPGLLPITTARELSETARAYLDKAVTYFENQQARMDYARRGQACLPIGSGVTESACKTMVKMRLCRAGAKWKEQGAAIV